MEKFIIKYYEERIYGNKVARIANPKLLDSFMKLTGRKTIKYDDMTALIAFNPNIEFVEITESEANKIIE